MPGAILQTQRHVVLVEDDPDVATLVEGIAQGHELTVYADGKSAVDALTGGAPVPHLVLLDLDLPKMHGFEVLKRLRHDPRTKRVPVVIFTATDSEPDEGYRLGANAWVAKSNNVDELEASLASILSFWAGLNQTSGSPRT